MNDVVLSHKRPTCSELQSFSSFSCTGKNIIMLLQVHTLEKLNTNLAHPLETSLWFWIPPLRPGALPHLPSYFHEIWNELLACEMRNQEAEAASAPCNLPESLKRVDLTRNLKIAFFPPPCSHGHRYVCLAATPPPPHGGCF